ncbi:MAG: ABC transporter ATP-binding protein [Actinobacteria bacterium]|nr:ABC transporter ATP-binding protein [Actinomycetota bacterium]MDI6830316.1 ABC transporter ATP-binding protein [Actinomycetota bacterium]
MKEHRDTLLEVRGLRTWFHTREGVVKAVDGVSFTVARGEALAVVGESGCGKTVTALSVMRLIPDPPGRIEEGEILFEGRDLLRMDDREIRQVRGNHIGMIFQDPMTSLNPVFTIGSQIREAIQVHLGLSRKEAKKRAIELLEMVEIPQAERRYKMYPHEFSGGMRQRAMIAMALSCQPKLLIADEPSTALDVTIQAQIMELIGKLREEIDLAVMLITHDLGVVAGVAETVLVMYAGKVVEYADIDRVYYNSRHPYAWSLMRSVPRLDEKKDRLLTIGGSPPSLINLPPGCSFSPRCPFGEEVCAVEEPPLVEVEPEHLSACHFAMDFERHGQGVKS